MTKKWGEKLQEVATQIWQDAETCDFPSTEQSARDISCLVNYKAVLKAMFQVKVDEFSLNGAVQTVIEMEDAAKVAKETIFWSKWKSLNSQDNRSGEKGQVTDQHQQKSCSVTDVEKKL